MADGRARRVDVPETVLARDSLSDPNYTCAFEIDEQPDDTRTAEQWLRAMLEGAGPALRSFIVTGWLGVLRLRLGPRPSNDHILGWKILSATPTKIVIGVEGSTLSAHQVVQCQDSKVVHVTIVHFDRSVAKAVWAVAAPIHVRTIPHFMNQARAKNSRPL
jgi:hypothetical protein